MADILSQEEIDALLDVCEDSTPNATDYAWHIERVKGFLNRLTLNTERTKDVQYVGSMNQEELVSILNLIDFIEIIQGSSNTNFKSKLMVNFLSTVSVICGIDLDDSGINKHQVVRPVYVILATINQVLYKFCFSKDLGQILENSMLGESLDNISSQDDIIDACKEIVKNTITTSLFPDAHSNYKIKSATLTNEDVVDYQKLGYNIDTSFLFSISEVDVA